MQRTRRQPQPSFVGRRIFRRRAVRAETHIRGAELPDHIRREVRRKHPHLSPRELETVEQGLREWFICCAWRRGRILGMPSRVVDDAWHAFILDSLAYTAFCDGAYRAYLHHTPEGEMDRPMPTALDDTVRAWDRSTRGSEEESVLWDLDQHLGIADPMGLSETRIAAARATASGGGAAGPEAWGGGDGGGGHGAHHGHGGCGAGAGCGGGGGCSGGGGCGGGS